MKPLRDRPSENSAARIAIGWGAFEHPGARRLFERVDRPRASGTGAEVGMSRREWGSSALDHM